MENDPSRHVDVNADGFADLVMATIRTAGSECPCENRLEVYYGSAVGFAAEPDVQSDFYSQVTFAGDYNGDGYSDVWVFSDARGGGNGQIAALHGGADGLSMTPAWEMAVPPGTGWRDVSEIFPVGDVNCDGYDDLFFGSYLIYGFAEGEPPATFAEPNPGYVMLENVGVPGSSAVGDMDGDGCDELVFNGQLFRGSSDGPVATGLVVSEGTRWSERSYRPIDLDGDGLMDIVYDRRVFMGDASGTPREVSQTIFTGTSAGDLNADGHDDLVRAIRSIPTSTPSSMATFSADQVREMFSLTLVSGDDLQSEVPWRQGSAAASVIGTTQEAWADGYIYFSWTQSWGAMLGSIGDINGDGFSDYIIATRGGAYAFVYNGGNEVPLEPSQEVFVGGDRATIAGLNQANGMGI